MSDYRTTMWEVVAAVNQLDRLLIWASEVVTPVLTEADPSCVVQVFYSSDNRVAIVATGSSSPPVVPDPPSWLCYRKPHQWLFERLDRFDASGDQKQQHPDVGRGHPRRLP